MPQTEGPERTDRLAEGEPREGDRRDSRCRWPGDHRHLLPEEHWYELPIRALSRRRPLNQDLLAGQIDFGFGQAASTFVHVRNGNLKVYAVMAKTGWPAAPDIPTIDEAGVSGPYASFLARALGAEGNAEGDNCKTQFSGAGSLADATVRQRFADKGQDIPPREQQTTEALRRATKGRDREVVANPQGGEHQGRVIRDNARGGSPTREIP